MARANEVCYTGFIMDLYCINRGTLLDAPKTSTLLHPDEHSIHCLTDVERCVHSGFEVLADEKDGSGTFCRVFELDQSGNEMALALARETGEKGRCTTCAGPDGAQEKGFRATVYGTIDEGSQSPKKLAVTRILPASEGCANATLYDPVASDLNCDSGKYQSRTIAHGTCMLLSWGFLLPSGVITAKFLRHREGALWFKIHRLLQPFGLAVAVAGWVVALVTFSVLGSGVHDKSFVHAVCGMITMSLGLFQPINAYLRPHKPEEGHVPLVRRVWEITHKSCGYIATILGIATAGIGTQLAGKYKDGFLGGYIAAIVVLVFYTIWTIFDKKRSSQEASPSEEESEERAGDEESPKDESGKTQDLPKESEKTEEPEDSLHATEESGDLNAPLISDS